MSYSDGIEHPSKNNNHSRRNGVNTQMRELTDSITLFNRSHYKGIEIDKDINIFGLRFCFDFQIGIRPNAKDNKANQLSWFDLSMLFRVDKEGIDSDENLCKSEPTTLFEEEGCFTWLNPKMNYLFINVEYGNLCKESKERFLEISVGEKNIVTI